MKKGFVLSIAAFSIIMIAKVNFDPVLVLEKEINFGGDIDKIKAAIPADDGFVVAGRRTVLNGQTYDKFAQVSKFDQNSNLVWEYTGDLNSTTWWQSLALAPDGIFIGESGENVLITKINNQGDLVWKKNIGSNAAPVLISNENILVVVLSQHTTCPIKVFDLNVNEINSWSVDLNVCYGTILDRNDLYILGDNSGGVHTNLHSEIIKTDLAGNVAWTDTLMDVHGLRGAIDINGDLCVSGYYLNNVQSYYRTVKYDLDGNRVWERYYDGDFQASYNLANYVKSVIAHPNGGCVVVGSLVKIGKNDPNMLDGGAISYDPNGDEYFKIRYDANPLWYRTTHQASLFSSDNRLMIFGTTYNLDPDTAQVLFMTKWDDVTGVEDNDYTIPDNFSLSQNYPNPFNPTTTIEYELSATAYVTIKVYDILGKEVANLINEEKSAGSHVIAFNAANLPSGTYFYRLQTGKYTDTKKMVLLR